MASMLAKQFATANKVDKKKKSNLFLKDIKNNTLDRMETMTVS
jgi:hypothetical protein